MTFLRGAAERLRDRKGGRALEKVGNHCSRISTEFSRICPNGCCIVLKNHSRSFLFSNVYSPYTLRNENNNS